MPPPSTPPPATAVPPGISIFPLAVKFGIVQVGTTATVPLMIVNGDSAPYGPVNLFGGAPPKPEFSASQNCQGTTLPAGGSCTITYTFTPSSTGSASDTSAFTVSPTSSQSDGTNFNVPLTGCGVPPNGTILPCLSVLPPIQR